MCRIYPCTVALQLSCGWRFVLGIDRYFDVLGGYRWGLWQTGQRSAVGVCSKQCDPEASGDTGREGEALSKLLIA